MKINLDHTPIIVLVALLVVVVLVVVYLCDPNLYRSYLTLPIHQASTSFSNDSSVVTMGLYEWSKAVKVP